MVTTGSSGHYIYSSLVVILWRFEVSLFTYSLVQFCQATSGKGFLLDVIGSKEQGLKQIFSNASEHSSLIIEYVKRYGSFDGFFTQENVAKLTEAAGFM